MEKLYFLILWDIIISVGLFSLMGSDKRRARAGAYRIPERTLFILAALGGAAGGWLGMRLFHHKTRHWYFRVGFPLLTAAQIFILVLIWRYV